MKLLEYEGNWYLEGWLLKTQWRALMSCTELNPFRVSGIPERRDCRFGFRTSDQSLILEKLLQLFPDIEFD